jgi:hypothetical protein
LSNATQERMSIFDVDLNKLCGSTKFNIRQVSDAFLARLADDVVAERDVAKVVAGKDPDEAYKDLLRLRYSEGSAH